MQATVYRLRNKGVAVDRALLRQGQAAFGDLELCLRLLGRVPSRNIYIASLRRDDRYVIPPLDCARVLTITGRWLLIEGEEVIVRRRLEDHHPQQWWCRIAPA